MKTQEITAIPPNTVLAASPANEQCLRANPATGDAAGGDPQVPRTNGPPERSEAARQGDPANKPITHDKSRESAGRVKNNPCPTPGTKVTLEIESEKIVLGGILRYGMEPAIGVRAEDFTVPGHREVFQFLGREPDRWIAGNLTANQAALAGEGLAGKLGAPNSLAFDLEIAAGDFGPLGIADFADRLVRSAIERKRREAAARFANGDMTQDEFCERNRRLDERASRLDITSNPPVEAVPLIDFLDRPPDPMDTLLGDRFLCREGSLLLVGPSGIGKSSASAQMDLCWSLGLDAFGIKPARPLRILQIQAENDEGDLHEMVSGCAGELRLTPDEREACRSNLVTLTEKARTAERFIKEVLALKLEKHRPDIVRIDPLLAYLGADPIDTARLSEFCRNWINPLLEKYRCACIINHHTPKTINRDTSNWRASDWMYSGAGGAELTNWARAILVIEPTNNPAAFRFIAAKRGRRVGWVDQFDQPTYQRVFCHSEGSIAWREATEEEAEGISSKNDRNQRSDEELMAYIPVQGTVPKNVLLAKWNKLGLGEKKCASRLNLFVADEVLHEWLEPRSGTRPRVLISRRPQTLL